MRAANAGLPSDAKRTVSSPIHRRTAHRRNDVVGLKEGSRSICRQSEGAGQWREITDDANAKVAFIKIMERMDNRYIGLGAPSGPLKIPLDQWIDQHLISTSPRGVGLFAWAPQDRSKEDCVLHLVLAVTFDKPVTGTKRLNRLTICMMGINREIYRRPTPRRIHWFGRLFAAKFVDLGAVGSSGTATTGKSVMVTAFRPKTMTWGPAADLHDRVLNDRAFELLTVRDCGHSFYWRFKVRKL